MDDIVETGIVSAPPWLARLEHVCVLATRPIA
jgi:hypothetical protein